MSTPPAALTPSIEPLIAAAEREAIRVAALMRSLVAVSVLLLFGFLQPPGVPEDFTLAIRLALVCNLGLAGWSWWLGTRTGGSRRSSGLFFVADYVLFIGLTLAAPLLLGVPWSMFAAAPAFLFGLLMLCLAALRFSPRYVAWLGLGVILFTAVMAIPQTALPPDLVQAVPGLAPEFSRTANLIRVLFLAGIGGVLVYIVARGRRLLIDGLSEAEHVTNLSRYLPGPVARLVAAQGLDALSRGRRQQAAVLFADIVGFTAISERLPPEAVGEILTEIRQLQREAIEGAGGIVDKFVGDAVMGVFGVPEPDALAPRRALDAAAAIERGMAQWNARRRPGQPLIRVGIGVHYGEVFAGAVGDAQRLEFATLGDTVNVAQRCEQLTRETGVPLVVTRAALEAAQADPAAWQPIPARTVRGRAGELELLRPAG